MDGRLVAPADGVIETIFDTRHAVSMTTAEGLQLLMHIGLDTVQLKGRFFEAHVLPNQAVRRGDLLLTFDLKEIKAAGYQTITPILLVNADEYADISILSGDTVSAGAPLLRVSPQ